MHLGSSDKKHISCLHLVRRFSPHLSAICKNYITKQQLCKKKKKKNVWHAHYLKKLAYSEPQLVCYRCGPVWFVFFFFFTVWHFLRLHSLVACLHLCFLYLCHPPLHTASSSLRSPCDQTFMRHGNSSECSFTSVLLPVYFQSCFQCEL